MIQWKRFYFEYRKFRLSTDDVHRGDFRVDKTGIIIQLSANVYLSIIQGYLNETSLVICMG